MVLYAGFWGYPPIPRSSVYRHAGPLGGETMSDQSHLLTPGAREQGFRLEEEGDHILILSRDGQELARFSQTGVKIAAIAKIIAQDVSKN